jgi:hypothetical protein
VDFDYPTVILSSVLFSTFKISKSELLLKPWNSFMSYVRKHKFLSIHHMKFGQVFLVKDSDLGSTISQCKVPPSSSLFSYLVSIIW